VLRKFDLVLSAALCCAVLTSCGGSPSPTPSPTPTPSGTGTGTPTPTPSATPVVFNYTSDFTLSTGGLYIYANFTPTGGTERFSDASRLAALAGLGFVASPEKVVFGFPDLTADVQYLGTERTTTTATQRIYARDETSLTLDKPFSNMIRATYKRTDPFTSGTTAGTLRGYRVALVTIPVTTTTAIAANLTYTGTPSVVGGTLGTTLPGAVTSTATTFTVVPAASSTTTPTITGTIRIFETVGGVTSEKAVLAFTGTLTTTGAISGTITDTANAFSGAFSGALAGPNREELALVFSVTHADGRKYVGDLLAD
jgi:hypothetical protein